MTTETKGTRKRSRGRPSSRGDAVAALAAYKPEITATELFLTYGENPGAAEATVDRETRRFGDFADASLAQVDATSDPIYGPDEALAKSHEAAEDTAYRRLLPVCRALSVARRKYGVSREAHHRLRDRVILARGRNRLDAADLEHAPVRRAGALPRCRRTRSSGPSGRPARRAANRGACRAGPDEDGDPEPPPGGLGAPRHAGRRPARTERRRPW